MSDAFLLEFLNMSLTGSIVIIFVLLVRLFLKRVPKIYSYLLWIVVLFRLVCPVSFESPVSLLPSNPHPISEQILYERFPHIDTGIDALDGPISSLLPEAAPYQSVNPVQILLTFFQFIWLAGIAGMLIYGIVSLIRLRTRLRDAAPEEDGVWITGSIPTAFVIGIIRPRIYLPAGLTPEEKQFILLHEKTHIRRCDPAIKAAAFLVLCAHWFNPLVWAAYFLCMEDMEMSCDESVIRSLGTDVKKEYSSSLLSLASGHRYAKAMPLAFGEGSPKSRIKNVLRYKKPAVWAGAAVLAAVLVFCAGFAANPRSQAGERLKNFVITSTYVTLQDGTRAELMLVMTDGVHISGEEAGYGGDIRDENDIGSCELRLYLDGRLISDYPLTKEDENGTGLIFHERYFPIAVADYNDDGNPDFSLGQWGSSSIRLYSLFTITRDGTILPVSDPLALPDSVTLDYSALFESDGSTVTTYRYNNASGEMEPQVFSWDASEHKFISES